MLSEYLKLTGGLNLEFKSYDINSVLKIDTLSLSPVFPPMANRQQEVIFDVVVPSLSIRMHNSVFTIKAQGHGMVAINNAGKK